MSLVTEAGYQGYPAFWAKRTLPLSASITSNASAPARLGASALAAQAMPTHMSVRARQDRVEDITARDSMLSLGKRAIGEKGLSRREVKGKSETRSDDPPLPQDKRSWS